MTLGQIGPDVKSINSQALRHLLADADVRGTETRSTPAWAGVF